MSFENPFSESSITLTFRLQKIRRYVPRIVRSQASAKVKRSFQLFIYIVLLFPILVEATPPPMPYRVGGTVTYKGVLLTQSSDTGFTFTVTKEDGTPFNPEAKDTNGLNSANYYLNFARKQYFPSP